MRGHSCSWPCMPLVLGKGHNLGTIPIHTENIRSPNRKSFLGNVPNNIECPWFSPVYTSTSWWDESEVLDKMSCGFDLFKSPGSNLTVWLLRRDRESGGVLRKLWRKRATVFLSCVPRVYVGLHLKEVAWGAILHQVSGAGSLQSMCVLMSWGTCQCSRQLCRRRAPRWRRECAR